MQRMSQNRLRLNQIDLKRWAERLNLPLDMPSEHPMRTTDAMRHLASLPDHERARVSRAYFRAYWSSGSTAHWHKVESGARHHLEQSNELEACADVLKRETQELIDKGGCGVPSFVVEAQLFWGQDRLFQALAQLTRHPQSPEVSLDHVEVTELPTRLRFFHDFSSPYSYLASTQIERICLERGFECEYVPILLGALFKTIGTANVPLFTFSEAKRAYLAIDLERWAEQWETSFRFPDAFPLRTVLPLRLALSRPELTTQLYQWAWQEGHNIGDPQTLNTLLSGAGYNASELLEAATNPSIKAQLKKNTDDAKKLGLCGVPTFVVDFADESYLVWGQDRLAMVEWMLDGWRPGSEKGEDP